MFFAFFLFPLSFRQLFDFLLEFIEFLLLFVKGEKALLLLFIDIDHRSYIVLIYSFKYIAMKCWDIDDFWMINHLARLMVVDAHAWPNWVPVALQCIPLGQISKLSTWHLLRADCRSSFFRPHIGSIPHRFNSLHDELRVCNWCLWYLL